MAARRTSSPELKRSRSSYEASGATSDSPPQKSSKLDNAALSPLRASHRSLNGLASSQSLQKVSCSSTNADSIVKDSAYSAAMDTGDAHPRSAVKDDKNVLLSTESIVADTPLEQRITAIEQTHNSPDGQTRTAFQQFFDLALFSTVRFELKRSNRMTSDELTACRDLVSSTSQKDYEASCIGWRPEDKMKEMSHADMMYLLVRRAQQYADSDNQTSQEPSTTWPSDPLGSILGFLSFKLEPEDEENDMFRPVAYIYEVHLDNQLRNRGLGARLIQWVEDQAKMVSISKMMLTVFAVNKGARRMYERQGFVRDPLSPEDKVTRRRVIEPDYIIMSKEIRVSSEAYTIYSALA